MKYILSVVLCISFFGTVAQVNTSGRGSVPNMQARSLFYSNVNGQPFSTMEAEAFIEGTPFFKTEWMKAAAVLPNGRLSTVFPARINLLKGQVHYLDVKGSEYIATSPMLELFLTDTISGAKYHFVKTAPVKKDNKAKDNWHQVLVADSIALYKVYNKTEEEFTSFGSNTPKKKVLTIEKYMVQQGNKASIVKRPKELIHLYPRYEQQLSDYIKSHPEKEYATGDAQFIELVKYLNSILK